MTAAVFAGYFWFRRAYVTLADDICDTLDDMISGKASPKTRILRHSPQRFFRRFRNSGSDTVYGYAESEPEAGDSADGIRHLSIS